MKFKALLLLLALGFTLLGYFGNVKASPTELYLDPDNVVGPPPAKGENFTLTLKVDEVSDLYLWVATIEWDPTVLELAENPKEGNCLKYGGYSTFFTWEAITPGKIKGLTCTLLGAPAGVNVPPAPNDLATIKFHVLNYAYQSNIKITFSDLLNSNGESIPHTVKGSKFTLLPDYIYSSDAGGVEKNMFVLGEQLYATVPAIGKNVTFYVLTNRSWSIGDSFERYMVYKASNVSVGSGAVWSTVSVWNIPNDPSFIGAYDLAMDTNNNGIYDKGDMIDDATVLPGFFLIPTLPLGTASGLAASLLAFAVYKSRRRSKIRIK